ncbi:hypothetical protein CALVIDRAFT_562825 [Calocera viscosa TUFC12733]|uniref:Uncharacterized protein n=1 Tax=Calocera viscosa (strain TUFC12733) TaxID=1330018 RepID=A0A167N8I9_CALVF|nr:hypothetical protein CALVIDRAFT_562825 [Calocera viscosa TUFC12733]
MFQDVNPSIANDLRRILMADEGGLAKDADILSIQLQVSCTRRQAVSSRKAILPTCQQAHSPSDPTTFTRPNIFLFKLRPGHEAHAVELRRHRHVTVNTVYEDRVAYLAASTTELKRSRSGMQGWREECERRYEEMKGLRGL